MADNETKAFRCTVCGYIHRGDSPPDECPVCGSPASYFEAYADPAAVVDESRSKLISWRCLVCNYEHKDENPPDKCPVCATPKEKFAATETVFDTKISDDVGKGEKIVVVGGGIAGVSAVESIRSVSSRQTVPLSITRQ